MFNSLFIALKALPADQTITWFDGQDFNTLLFRLGVNLFFLTVIIRFLYYPKTKRKGDIFKNAQVGKEGAKLKEHAHATTRNHQLSRGHLANITAFK